MKGHHRKVTKKEKEVKSSVSIVVAALGRATPHLKVKGKDGKLAQEEWHMDEAKGNAPGFCLAAEVTEKAAC